MEEKVINLKSLFLYPVYHWKSMLCTFLVFLILGTALAMVPPKENSDSEEGGNSFEQKMRAYQSEKAALEGNKTFLRSKIDDEQFYLNNSILMGIDAMNAYQADYKIHIATDYQILPSMEYQNPDQTPMILSQFAGLLSDLQLMDSIAQELHMESWQLDELFSAWVSAGNTLQISVTGGSADQVKQIMDLIKKEMPGIEKTLQAAYGDFQVSVIQDSLSRQVLTDLADSKNQRIATLMDDQKDYNDTIEQLKELEAPSDNRSKKLIVVFAFLGLFFPYGIYCLSYITTSRLLSANDLKNFRNTNYLGSILGSKRRDKLTMRLRKLEDRACSDDAERYALIAENLRIYADSRENLIITGDASAELVKAVSEKLQAILPEKKLQYQDSLLTSAAGVASLGSSDGVVLVEQCMVSDLKHIHQELTKVQAAGKAVIGCIVADY